MSARRFSEAKDRAARRLRASDDDILEAMENALETDPATAPKVKQLIAKRRAWRQIAEGPPLSMAAHKRLVYMIEDDDLTRVQDLTSLIVGKLFVTEDGTEGVRSFMERREPVFRGR